MATINGKCDNTAYSLKCDYTYTQVIANNQSTITAVVYIKSNGSYSTQSAYWKCIIGGTTVTSNKSMTLSGSSWKELGRKTWTVTHANDGSYSGTLSFSYSNGLSSAGTYTTKSGSGSGSLAISTIPRASSISVSSGSGTKPGNGSISLSISRASSSFTHTVNWSCGGSSGTVASGASTSASWAVPLSLVTQSPNGNQTVTFTCYTYSGGSHIGTSTCSATVGYHGASTVSGSNGSTIGSSKSFTISRSNESFTHSLWYSFGNVSWAGIGSGLGTSASFTPPMSLCSQIPSATSGSMTIILRTYYGSTQIGGDQYYYYTMNVPDSVVPSFSDVTHVENVSEVSTLVGLYVQNKTRLTCEIIGATGSYSSSITSYKITVGGQTINASSGTTGILTVSGNQTLTATITDSRGRTATRSKTFNVLPYTHPKITGAGVNRDSDTTALVTANLSATSLLNDTAEKNNLKYKIEYKAIDDYSYLKQEAEFQSIEELLSYTITGLNISKSYEFRVYVGDIFGYSSTPEIFKISTAFKSFDFDVKTGRIGIKKVLEHEDSVIEFPEESKLYVGNQAIDLKNIGIAQYRIGDVIISTNTQNPSETYGGTWELLCPGKTLVCIDTSDSDFNAVKKTGGSKFLQSHNHSVTVNSGGAHNHSASSASAGAHSHTITVNSGGAHTHTYTGYIQCAVSSSATYTAIAHKRYTADGTSTPASMNSTGSHSHSASSASAGAHAHSVTVDSGGSHAHSASSANSGSGNSQNLQPFMVVYMWVRVA